jgi:hypothetical protein
MTNEGTRGIQRVLSPLIVCTAFVFCAALGSILYPETFNKFFSPHQIVHNPPPQLPHRSYYWDVEHYASKALNNVCNAFYPLWSLIIRFLFHPQTLEQAAHYCLILATILSIVSIFPTVWVFEQALEQKYLALLLVLSYYLNPMSIFRVIGYTESLFSVFIIIFISAFVYQKHINQLLKIFILCSIAFLMCLTRPVLIQILFSALASLVTIVLLENLKKQLNSNNLLVSFAFKHEIKITVGICVSAVLGYSVYGLSCLKSRGNFFAPFQDQQYWGKSLGLHLELLFLPKAPLFDLLGLYLPLMVWGLAITLVYLKLNEKEPFVFVPKSPSWNILILYPPLLIILYVFNFIRLKKKELTSESKLKQLKISEYTKTLSTNYLFWFCVYFPVAHSVIVILTQDRLFSLSRFVFAVPFFFLAVGYLCRCIPSKKTSNAVVWFILISAIALVQQWVNYGKDEWLG